MFQGARSLVVFAGMSLAIHAAVFLNMAPGSISGGGDGGDTVISLQAAPDGLNALVETWTRAPEATTSTAHQSPPEFDAAAAAVPRVETEVTRANASTIPVVDQPSTTPLRQTAPPELTKPNIGLASGQPPRLGDMIPAKRPMAQPLPVAASPSPAPQVARMLPHPDVRPVRRPASQAQASARSNGTGASVAAGNDGVANSAKLSASDAHALQAEWSASIQSRIARFQKYPSGNHGDGRVKVQMVILKTGELKTVSLATSSGTVALDTAALRAVQRAAPFPPAPDGLSDAWYRVAQWMNFRRR